MWEECTSDSADVSQTFWLVSTVKTHFWTFDASNNSIPYPESVQLDEKNKTCFTTLSLNLRFLRMPGISVNIKLDFHRVYKTETKQKVIFCFYPWLICVLEKYLMKHWADFNEAFRKYSLAVPIQLLTIFLQSFMYVIQVKRENCANRSN